MLCVVAAELTREVEAGPSVGSHETVQLAGPTRSVRGPLTGSEKTDVEQAPIDTFSIPKLTECICSPFPTAHDAVHFC